MTGTVLPAPVFRAVDANGLPMAGALLQFYLSATTTPTPVYSSAALSVALPNPVVADSGGLFPPIYLDPTILYRAQLLTSGGALVENVDPVSSVNEATQGQVNGGVATGVYVSPAKLAAWTGVATALGFTPLNRGGDTATNLKIANTSLATNSAGFLGVPINTQTSNYTLALGDAGGMVRSGLLTGSITWTIPPSSAVAFPIGTAVTFRNWSATATIQRGSGVALYKAGSSVNQDVALAAYGLATAVLEYPNIWVISGVGIS